MATAPVHRMRKVDIVKMARWRCEHSVSGLEHYNCWLRHHPDTERVGFLDLECSNLSADFGIILAYCIADKDSDHIYNGVISKRDLSTVLDKRLVESCIKDIGNFDRIWGYYSSRFDMPFLRTRAVSLGVDFPEHGTVLHNDLYYTIRNKFKLSRNRLDNACLSLLGSTTKTRITAEYWIKALQGDKTSLEYILDHCKEDVKELKRLYLKTVLYRKGVDTSI